MKKICLLLPLILFYFFSSYSQIDSSKIYLFPEFKEGYLLHKNGSRIKGVFNYNIILEEMLFRNSNNDILKIAEPSRIVLAVIDDRKFEPIRGNVFYERFSVNDQFYYVQYKSKLMSQGKPSAYGGYSQTSVADNVEYTDYGQGDKSSKIKVDQKNDILENKTYYIKDNGKFRRINSLTNLLKIFPQHKSEIESYIQDNNLNLKNSSDIQKTIEYSLKHFLLSN